MDRDPSPKRGRLFRIGRFTFHVSRLDILLSVVFIGGALTMMGGSGNCLCCGPVDSYGQNTQLTEMQLDNVPTESKHQRPDEKPVVSRSIADKYRQVTIKITGLT